MPTKFSSSPAPGKRYKNIFSSAFALLALLVVVFILFGVYRAQIKVFARNAVENFGLPALLLLTWLSDVIIQPIPADVFVFGSTFGGGNLLAVALVAGNASAVGGMTGFFLGRWFGPWRFRQVFGRQLLRRGRNLFKNYGALAVFVSGVTPIPYSACCWVAGIYNMSAVHLFFASVVSRTLRYIFIGWLGQIV